MIKGFSNLVKKRNKYVHVSLNNIRPSYRSSTITRTTRENTPRQNNKQNRIANTLVKIKPKNIPNRVGSVLGKEPFWHGDRKLLNSLIRTGQKIGNQSVHGVVKRLSFHGVDNRYVIKKISFRQQQIITQGMEQRKLRWFRTELRVGTMPHIEAVGPRIHAWRLVPDGAEYVMDNVELGDPNAKTYTFYQIKKHFKKFFNPAVEQVLDKFHQITGGQHGDFHGERVLL